MRYLKLAADYAMACGLIIMGVYFAATGVVSLL